jgi:hypothetical protein
LHHPADLWQASGLLVFALIDLFSVAWDYT